LLMGLGGASEFAHEAFPGFFGVFVLDEWIGIAAATAAATEAAAGAGQADGFELGFLLIGKLVGERLQHLLGRVVIDCLDFLDAFEQGLDGFALIVGEADFYVSGQQVQFADE